MVSPERLSQPEVLYKEPLSNEQLGDLISSVGNNEAKAATLLVMKPGVIYSSSTLRTALRRAQGNAEGWRMGNNLPFNYCEKSFGKIGLVVAESVDEHNNMYGYVKTDYGETVGNNFAATILDFSDRYPDVSLYQIFGNTASSSKAQEKGEIKKRAPITRLRIFNELLRHGGKIEFGELAQLIGEQYPSVISIHIEELSKAGLVNYTEGMVAISDDKQKMFVDLAITLDNFQQMSTDVNTHAGRTARHLLAHPERLASLLEKAKEHSRNAEQFPTKQTFALILSIIRDKPNIGTSEIAEVLQTKYGKWLSDHRTRRLIKSLERQGELDGTITERGKILWRSTSFGSNN